MREFLAAMVGLAFAVMAFGLFAALTCFVVAPRVDSRMILTVIVSGGVLGLAAAIVAGFLGVKLVLGKRD